MATPTTVSKREPRALPELVQSLPQELFDRIYKETFSWSAGTQYVVDGDGKVVRELNDSPNAALTIAVNSRSEFAHPSTSLVRVDRFSRYKVLKQFYSNTIFEMFDKKGDIRAAVWVKECRHAPGSVRPDQCPFKRHVMPTSCPCEEPGEFARALFANALGCGLRCIGARNEHGNVDCYNWVCCMEDPSL